MFFSITQKFNDERFTKQHAVGDFYIHLDRGWSSKTINDSVVFYKGYADSALLENLLEDFVNDPTPRQTGNFCIIIANSYTVTVTHDVNRAFPLKFYNQNILTNFPFNDELGVCDDIWADCWVRYSKNNKLIKNYYNCFYCNEIETGISSEQCKNKIHQLLSEKISGLDQFKRPIRVFLSGGIDTTFVYSMLKSHLDNNDIELVTGENFENTEFFAINCQNFRNNALLWGYRQFHNWRISSVYATGGMGDEIFLRGPTAAAIICAWHNIDLMRELSNIEYCYHKKYFQKEKNQKIVNYYWQHRKELQASYPGYKDICNKIISMIVNDHQHWHFENTVTWTPLKDIRILNAILSLTKKDLLDQIMTGFVEKQLIEEFSPGMQRYICDYKNLDQYKNLIKYQPWADAINAGM